MEMKMRALVIFLPLFSLTGCTTALRGQFDCSGTPGVQCKSISEVNRMVDKGIIPKNKSIDKTILATKGKSLRRSKEEVLTVWVAPFEDEEGVFHEPGRLTAVVNPAQWELSKA